MSGEVFGSGCGVRFPIGVIQVDPSVCDGYGSDGSREPRLVPSTLRVEKGDEGRATKGRTEEIDHCCCLFE